MLRISFLQLWFDLSDPTAEEAICKFRSLLTEAEVGKKMLVEVNEYLASRGHRIQNGTIVDAAIIIHSGEVTAANVDDCTRCPTCCMEMRPAFGETVHISVRPQR